MSHSQWRQETEEIEEKAKNNNLKRWLKVEDYPPTYVEGVLKDFEGRSVIGDMNLQNRRFYVTEFEKRKVEGVFEAGTQRVRINKVEVNGVMVRGTYDYDKHIFIIDPKIKGRDEK